ncbi:MAG: cytochrome o ubiquinol oxidase subunit III [Candidatus Sphingomonas colombiensis]|nr:cytochrome o ubiquinol oxidase subunit III [Sphingomonas sp.]WEK41788.1 MAG: cytochrome o ubiquinol oxidase subunit III [Sphingomonas sp.]
MAQRNLTAADGTPVYWETTPHHEESGSSTMLGFWIYIMSDCLIFAMLFASWGVYGRNFAGGPTSHELFDLKLVALNTALLLFSSITYGFAMIAAHAKRKQATLGWLAVTLLFGLGFLAIELYEFSHFIHEGAGPSRSAFLSSFFTLVGTHGLHVTFGSIWLVVLMVQVSRKGLLTANVRRLECLSLFWHFLDVVWIGVFTFVYLLGSMA